MYYINFIEYISKDNTNGLFVCLILILYCIISEVFSRAHDNKYQEGSFFSFVPILREYILFKILFGEIIATIATFVYIIPLVLYFINKESIIILNIIIALDVITLILTLYIVILFVIFILRKILKNK